MVRALTPPRLAQPPRRLVTPEHRVHAQKPHPKSTTPVPEPTVPEGFTDLPIAEALAILFPTVPSRSKRTRSIDLSGRMLYLESLGFAPIKLVGYFKDEGGGRQQGETGYVLSKLLKPSEVPSELKSWYDNQVAIAQKVLEQAKEQVERNITKLKASGKDYERTDIIRIYKNAYPKWSDQYKRKAKELPKKLAYEAKIAAWKAKRAGLVGPEKWWQVVAGETIVRTDKDIPRELRMASAEEQEKVGVSKVDGIWTQEMVSLGKGQLVPKTYYDAWSTGQQQIAADNAAMGVLIGAGVGVVITPQIDVPEIIRIEATPEEIKKAEEAKAEAEAHGCSCFTKLNEYKVTLRDGRIIVVVAFDDRVARDKAEGEEYKVAWVTKKMSWETIEPISVKGDAYNVTLKDGTVETVLPITDTKIGKTIYLTQAQIDIYKETTFYEDAEGTEQDKLWATQKSIQTLPKVDLPDGQTIPRDSVLDKDGNIAILGWKDIPKYYQDIAESQGLDVMSTQMTTDREGAMNTLKEAGFVEELPEGSYMQAAGSPPLREFTIPNMAQFARNNPDGMEILKHYGFLPGVLAEVEQFNKEAVAVLDYISISLANHTLTQGERFALERALDAVGKGLTPTNLYVAGYEGYDFKGAAEEGVEAYNKVLGAVWFSADKDTRVATALFFDKDYTKVSHFSSFARQLQHLSAKNLGSQILLAPLVAVVTPIGKQLTLEDAKKQLSEDYSNELSSLKGYVNKTDGTFNITQIQDDLLGKPDFEQGVLEDTGYKNSKELVSSLEYYNYGTTVTSKEWAMAGLTLGLLAIPFAGRALSSLGVVGGLIKHGIPASLAGIMMPDTIRLLKDKDVSAANKVFVAAITVALLSGAVWATGKFAFRELRQFAPGKFESSGVSLEISIPRGQLKANMTPKMAQTLVGDLEKVWGSGLPDEMIKAVGQFKTPADFQVWASAVVRQGVMSTHIKGVAGNVALGGIKGRANPLQAALHNNVLFSIKPDMRTYGAIIGKSKSGIDTTPAGSMEWWSPNFSGDVAGWYLGKVKQFVPGGKMLRFSPADIKVYPPEIFIQVAKQMQNSKVWSAIKVKAKGDNVTAINMLVQREVYRRALLPSTNPQALPSGIYPVFKFHWSREPSGQLRPTWELEMITPAGFSAKTFKPVRYLDKFKTGESGTPEVASLTVRSPIEGRDFVSGQRIRLGQPMPVIIQATTRALAEGKGLPTLKELYGAKYLYRPIAAIQNIFSRGKLVRPRATEGSLVTTPHVWRSRVIKFDKLKVNPSDVVAKRTLLKIAPEHRLSTAKIASKIEGHRPDAQGRFSLVRDPYYHPIREYADNWVNPRVGVMVKHPTIKGAYIVGTDTSRAAQPGVWDIIGGQIDVLGVPRVARPFGRISLLEAAREQVISEMGIKLKNVSPGIIHLGKTTEHSAFGTYMFNATAKSAKFKIPMNKWYDMIKGEWVFEPELSAIGVLKSGQRGAVTPALYIELARRGFDVRNLVVVDIGLPTSGIRQYLAGTFEYNTLRNANIYRPWEIGGIGKGVAQIPKNEALIKAEGSPARIQSFQQVIAATSPEEFVIPTSYRSPVFTGLVPTLRPPLGYTPTMVIERTSISKLPMSRITPPYADMETLFKPSYMVATPRTSIKTYEAPRVVIKSRPPLIKTYTPTTKPPTTKIPTLTTPITTYIPIPRPVRKEPKRGFIPLKGKAVKREKIPEGSIAWRQGLFWKYIPPPWKQEKPITLKHPPIGALRTGDITPENTIQMIGKAKARIPKDASIDLGVVDIKISDYGKKISYTGKGEETVVGHRIPSTTSGMSIPAKGVVRIRGKGTKGYSKLAFGTKLRLLTAETYDKAAIPKKFADRVLSQRLSKMKPKNIVLEIKEARITPERRSEILRMLPDRVRREIELWETMQVEYAPIKRLPRVEKLPAIFRKGNKKKKKEIVPSTVTG